ncbi:catalase [Idiomarina aquatica]|uniref:Catalase-related peroxidase n=1 Tax=Idiomarina aquatica TaxID=1327752 RepID=A0A4R6PQC5_9GAMM|nr:catalase family peroxidase [Idiomarina aquatica]TDP39162.1 catalase [Idiomarina aquatica]
MKKYLGALLALPMLVFAQQSERVTAQQFVDLQQGQNAHEGFRRAHAKGICVTGEFRSNGSLTDYSNAAVFNKGAHPFVGRFSIAGNNPSAPDLKAPVRSLALSFATSAAQQWRIAMNTPPVMAVSDPHTFYQQIKAIQSGTIAEFFAEHPESADFIAWKDNYQPSGSFAAEQYHSINAFYLTKDNGDKQPVRWAMRPTVNVANTSFDGDDALQNELTERLTSGPVIFDWVFTLATSEDDENDPAVGWPESREQIVAGQIAINDWQKQLNGDCHEINYDPLVLPDGIEATRDPILRARSAAYAESYRRRAVEVFNGAFEEQQND